MEHGKARSWSVPGGRLPVTAVFTSPRRPSTRT